MMLKRLKLVLTFMKTCSNFDMESKTHTSATNVSKSKKIAMLKIDSHRNHPITKINY